MIEPANFAALVGKAMNFSGRGHMRPVIEKELLHYDILFSLDKEGLLDILTFQGGTSLRLCYGAPRFSFLKIKATGAPGAVGLGRWPNL